MYTSAAHCVILAFGGIRRAARMVGRQPGAVRAWKKRGKVPPDVQKIVMNLARQQLVDITAEELILGRTD